MEDADVGADSDADFPVPLATQISNQTAYPVDENIFYYFPLATATNCLTSTTPLHFVLLFRIDSKFFLFVPRSMSCKLQSGGMFNSYKVKYSPETHQLLKVLMEEAKMTSAMRNQMRDALRKGEPLPVVSRRPTRPSYVDENLFDLKKNYYFFRRSKDEIIRSGAYDRDRYKFLERTVDLEKEKERLRNIMSEGKTFSKGKKEIGDGGSVPRSKLQANDKPIKAEERAEELVSEIEERLQFLKEMECLGLVKKYEFIIKQEIGAKLRELRKLDKNAEEIYSQFLRVPARQKRLF